MFALGAVLLSSVVLVPIFVQELLGYTAQDAGMVLTPGGLALVVIMPIMGQLVTRVDLVPARSRSVYNAERIRHALFAQL